MNLIVRMPFPAPELFPNRKNGKHWSATNAVKAKQHADGYNATKAAGAFEMQDGYIPLSLLFLTPDGRKRDVDNMLAASKALIDGMAQALGVDDRRFRPVFVDWVRGPNKAGLLIAGVGVQQMAAALQFAGVK